MNNIKKMLLPLALFPLLTLAQTSTVNLSSTAQTIRGFGGMNFPRWIPDLTSNQVDKAFGNGKGQIGLSILRINVSSNSSQWNLELPTAKLAASHGAIVFGTPWSPPASMKTNGSTTKGSLRTSDYGAYANYLRDFTNYMSTNGVSLYAISIQNEPDYLPNYESCGWTGSQILTFLDNNAAVIPTKVIAPETVHYKSSYMNAIASAAEVDILANHAYGGSPTRHNSSKEQWMTEHYAPNSNANSANNWPEALEAGKEIHDYLINGYNAYVWWYIRRSYGLITEDGNVSKRGYVMSHYSKFVRPGYVRVNANASPTSGVSVSAYKDGNKLVVVAINQNASAKNLTLNFTGGNVSNITKWETTGNPGTGVNEVGTYSGGSSFTNSLTGHSITTFTGTIGEDSGNHETDVVWLEAECGNVGSLWVTSADGNASNGSYVSVEPGNNSTGSAPSSSSGHISYNFNVSSAGNYNLWARVITTNANDDSFWVRMDGGSWNSWNNIAPGANSWTWDNFTSYSLSSGNHTLTIAYREDGAKLDKLYLSGAGSPSGTGSNAATCSGSTNPNPTTSIAIQENQTGFCSVDGSIDNNHSNYMGAGFANTSNASGKGISWSIAGGAGDYTFKWRYANQGANRTGVLSINGSNVSTEDFNTTGGWASWSTTSVTISNVAAGTKTIRLQADQAAGLANIDYLEVTGPSVAVAGCSGSRTAHEHVEANLEVAIYPNPIHRTVNINLGSSKEGVAIIHSLSGQVIESYELKNPVNKLAMAHLPPGIYLIRVKTGQKSYSQRILKQ